MASPVQPQSIVVAVTGLVTVAPFVVIAVLNVRFASRGWTPLAQLVTAYLGRYPVRPRSDRATTLAPTPCFATRGEPRAYTSTKTAVSTSG